MPNYDLLCVKCGAEHKIQASIKEKEAGISCPNCGESKMETLFKAAPATIRKSADCPNIGVCGGCPRAV